MREYIQNLVGRVRQACRGLYDIREEKSGRVEYPVTVPIVSFSEEKGSVAELLGGESLLEQGVELVVTVLTDELEGKAYGRACLEEICRKILAVDDERWIESLALQGCEYDGDLCAYRTTVVMRLRECGLCEEV